MGAKWLILKHKYLKLYFLKECYELIFLNLVKKTELTSL